MSTTTNPTTNPYESSQVETGMQVDSGKADLMSTLFSFQGRAPRSVFWCYSLAASFGYFAIVTILSIALGSESAIAGILSLALYVPLLWITLALQVKRWHDRDKSGWWVLVSLVPFIGPLWVFIEAGCLPGTAGPNRYGADPRQSL